VPRSDREKRTVTLGVKEMVKKLNTELTNPTSAM
jgi:hypothetical protein